MAKNEANEQYSVFDDPIEHTPPKKSGSKMTVLIICIVVAVCIGAAAVAASTPRPGAICCARTAITGSMVAT